MTAHPTPHQGIVSNRDPQVTIRMQARRAQACLRLMLLASAPPGVAVEVRGRD